LPVLRRLRQPPGPEAKKPFDEKSIQIWCFHSSQPPDLPESQDCSRRRLSANWPWGQCPLWVRTRHVRRNKRCPLQPQ